MNKTDFILLFEDNPGNKYDIFLGKSHMVHIWYFNSDPHRFVVYFESSDDVLGVSVLL